MIQAVFSFKEFNKPLIKKLTKLITEKTKAIEFHSFSLGISFQKGLTEKGKEELRNSFRFPLIDSLKKELKKKFELNEPELELLIDFNAGKIFFKSKPIYLHGYYNKYSRKLPQTIHYCYECRGIGCKKCKNTGKISKESIQELVAEKCVKAFKAEDNKFHGAGREDVDVRMLGKGRQFVIELIQPKKRVFNLKKLEETINKKNNKKLKIKKLSFTGKEKIKEIKSLKTEKIYSATVKTNKKINKKSLLKLKSKILAIKQLTPLRILERKKEKERKKKIEILEISSIKEKSFKIELKAESGTYVKEFLSGDENRTKPNLPSLLKNPCNCISLDVKKIM
ncbi:MAG: tRNA pseudouridine(54/55) synthase Pus10 [archaeon]